MTLGGHGAPSKPPSPSQKHSASREPNRSRLVRRPRISKSFGTSDTKRKDHDTTGKSESQESLQALGQPRRNSVPSAKTLISAIYREKRPSNRTPDTPDVNIDFSPPDLYSDLLSTAEIVQSNLEKDITDSTANVIHSTVGLRPKTAHVNSQRLSKETTKSHKNNIPRIHVHDTSGSKSHTEGNHTTTNTPLPWGNTLSLVRTVQTPTTASGSEATQDHIDSSLAYHPQKNEAEVVEPGQEKGTLASSAAAMFNTAGRGGGAGAGAPANRKPRAAESIDRELASHYRNSMAGRRLKSACATIDRRCDAELSEFKHIKQQLSKQYKEILMRSPSTDDWLNYRKYRTASQQERERENISRKYHRRARQFRAPPGLQDTVSNIRCVAMYEAGLLDANDPSSKDTISTLLQMKKQKQENALAGEFTQDNINGVKLSSKRINGGWVSERVRGGSAIERREILKSAIVDPNVSESKNSNTNVLDSAPVTPRMGTPHKVSSTVDVEPTNVSNGRITPPEDDVNDEPPKVQLLPNQRRLSMADIQNMKGILQNGEGLIASIPKPTPRSSLKSRRGSAFLTSAITEKNEPKHETTATDLINETKENETVVVVEANAVSNKNVGDIAKTSKKPDIYNDDITTRKIGNAHSDNDDSDEISSDSDDGSAGDDDAFEKDNTFDLTMTI